ncbi:hypothetical protein FDUTEX481_05494 [Tolypothrix sp. PCC 7601]|nr:hypothetical protein FDUTEX481_05494 [Tolypothrix sp. PCC 7601]
MKKSKVKRSQCVARVSRVVVTGVQKSKDLIFSAFLHFIFQLFCTSALIN